MEPMKVGWLTLGNSTEELNKTTKFKPADIIFRIRNKELLDTAPGF
jgi:hypothetical protein